MLEAVVIGTKSLHPHEQTIFMNPIGTLALVTLFRPLVTQSGNQVRHQQPDDHQVLKKNDVVGIIDIGNRDPVTKLFVNSILQQVVQNVVQDDNSPTTSQCEYSNNVTFLPLKNKNRLRQSMSI
jgi:hypothetical protein